MADPRLVDEAQALPSKISVGRGVDVTCYDVHVIFLSHLPELVSAAALPRRGLVAAVLLRCAETKAHGLTRRYFQAEGVILRRALHLGAALQPPRLKGAPVAESAPC